jgi:DNA-directed RNA polymerase subunit RPC12/RpoP
MTILSGEEVSEGAAFRCQKCNHEIKVGRGQSVPKCAYCGHDIFDDGSGQDTIH